MKKIVLATGNPGKVREITRILTGLGRQIVAQSDYQVPEAEETGLTFVENAIIKARNAAKYTGLPAIADDSGIEVDALKGMPGVYSARYAGEHSDDQANNKKLLAELGKMNNPSRCARFQCVIVYLQHPDDPTPIICQGVWEGRILDKPEGSEGFGYDPLFFVPTHSCSSAELDRDEKNRISHRGQALLKLLDALTGTELR